MFDALKQTGYTQYSLLANLSIVPGTCNVAVSEDANSVTLTNADGLEVAPEADVVVSESSNSNVVKLTTDPVGPELLIPEMPSVPFTLAGMVKS